MLSSTTISWKWHLTLVLIENRACLDTVFYDILAQILLLRLFITREKIEISSRLEYEQFATWFCNEDISLKCYLLLDLSTTLHSKIKALVVHQNRMTCGIHPKIYTQIHLLRTGVVDIMIIKILCLPVRNHLWKRVKFGFNRVPIFG